MPMWRRRRPVRAPGYGEKDRTRAAAPLDVSRDVEFGFVDRAADPKRLLNES